MATDPAGPSGTAGPSQRLDRFLWFVRLVKTRSLAQAIAQEGRLRIDGRVVDRAHAPVRLGNVLTFALNGRVRVIRVEALPTRRGPAPEAGKCYADLSPPVLRTTCSKGEDVDAPGREP
ncbi:ribosome-associated heat shock protein Hsp15 [Sphingomonas zeicaulis]|uniref:RNA-binding S4 domain-containing protein n=1 Tax=Sphingomonas zeicaulis TaxID=1632740 RepID=UPI003D2636D6